MRTLFSFTILAQLCAVSCGLLTAQTTILLPASAGNPVQRTGITKLLHAEDYHGYVSQFAHDEQEATGQAPRDAWPWMAAHVPLFSSSNKQFEEMYYFRWYAWQKHIVQSKQGWLVTEWLPKPDATDGFFGALPDAAPFHLGEARWLRNSSIAEDYARFWTRPDAGARKYSFPLAASVRDVTLATGKEKLGMDLLSALEANYSAWDASNLDASTGLYWQIDTRDAMEKSIGGDGYRPVLNLYMAADARAIAEFARAAGQNEIATQYDQKAATLEKLMEAKLWNDKDQFYETLSPSADSGIRKQKRFIDPGTQLQSSNVRELIGYIPWLYATPAPEHAVAWKQLFDPQGFAGKYGPTTAERRSPRFRFTSSDQCTWNGPSWPFATTQTLLALANILNENTEKIVSKDDYYKLFSSYVNAQHLTLPSGRKIDWIDEDLDADTDEWIAKDMLLAKHKQVGRGNYYNHSGFADPLITGLIGLRPQHGDAVHLNPLLPAESWRYFALDGLPYHGHLLTILYDATGKHYHRGRGFMLFVDGKLAAQRKELGPLQASLTH
ncbi:MGH1-like glycoside hydrolase domain-containing protein [Telmatobacter bradus]|uniref:MGH1-like glycoside hydrolase domain-containing protein n=1 Tax=Telmatobacter bradus TaxID=474953 RepID=UPI003B43C0CF